MCILSCPTSNIANCKTYTYSADNFWLTCMFALVIISHGQQLRAPYRYSVATLRRSVFQIYGFYWEFWDSRSDVAVYYVLSKERNPHTDLLYDIVFPFMKGAATSLKTACPCPHHLVHYCEVLLIGQRDTHTVNQWQEMNHEPGH